MQKNNSLVLSFLFAVLFCFLFICVFFWGVFCLLLYKYRPEESIFFIVYKIAFHDDSIHICWKRFVNWKLKTLTNFVIMGVTFCLHLPQKVQTEALYVELFTQGSNLATILLHSFGPVWKMVNTWPQKCLRYPLSKIGVFDFLISWILRKKSKK